MARLNLTSSLGMLVLFAIFWGIGSIKEREAKAEDYPPGVTPSEVWEGTFRVRVRGWECREAAALAEEVHSLGVKLKNGLRDLLAKHCGSHEFKAFGEVGWWTEDLKPASYDPRTTPHVIDLPEEGTYRGECRAPFFDPRIDEDAVWRATQLPMHGFARAWQTPLEKAHFACSHKALAKGLAFESAGNWDAAASWFAEADVQGSTAASYTVGSRHLAGRKIYGRFDDLPIDRAEAAGRVISAANLDYPPAYVPAADLILKGLPRGSDDIFSDYGGRFDLAMCFLHRAAEWHGSGHPNQKQISHLHEMLKRRAAPEQMEEGLRAAQNTGQGCDAADSVSPNYLHVSEFGRHLYSDLPARQAHLTGELIENTSSQDLD